MLHAGGKFENSAYKVSGGLHGVGVSVVNALSEWLELEIYRNGRVHQQRFERGVPTGDLYVTGVTEKRGTKVAFKADGTVFETTEFSFETLSQRLRELAFLMPAWQSQSKTNGSTTSFCTEGGIRRIRRVPEQEPDGGSTRSPCPSRRARRHHGGNHAAVERQLHRERPTPSRTTSTPPRAARTCPGSGGADAHDRPLRQPAKSLCGEADEQRQRRGLSARA